MRAVHQFVPTLHRGDAVGRHTLSLRDALTARGVASRIFVETPDPATETESQPYTSYTDAASAGDVLVYQLATASGMAAWLAARAEMLVVNYHNVTPPEHYAPWDNGLARHQLRAQSELALLAPRATLAVTDSHFDEEELRRAGYARTAVVPPAAVLPELLRPHVPTGSGLGSGSGPGPGPRPSASLSPELPTRGTRWLSIGRLAPNKALQYAVAGLLVARRHHDARATLDVVGRPVVPAYARALRRYVDELGLHDAVTFHGGVGDAALAEWLHRADVVVLTSEHEGFGVPAVEALAAGVPVVANRAGALPEILGDAGVLVHAPDPYAVAHGVAAALGARHQPDAHATQLAAARRRLDQLDLEHAADRTVDLISAL